MTKQYHTAVVIGRFQIVHSGHLHLINEASKLANNVVVVVGSVDQPRTPKNPFSFTERKRMLESSVNLVDMESSLTVVGVRDKKYNPNEWVVDVVTAVNNTMSKAWTDKPNKVAIVGHRKDHSSYYLDMFNRWDVQEVDNHGHINATDLRDNFYTDKCVEYIPATVIKFLDSFKYSEDYKILVREDQFLKDYKKSWESAPFPPVFVTVDAVVTQSCHIAMIQRKDEPGKGLWALPGGFLDITKNETLRQASVRELEEETNIKLQTIILDRSITGVTVYDQPERSGRGRTINHAFRFELSGRKLPKLAHSSDAMDAKWIPLDEVYMMGSVIFEDHLDIIQDMVK